MSSRLPADQRRRQLLEIACRVFADTGFHASAMDDIAHAAGVTKPVLYQHFASKRALFTEVLNDVGGQLLTSLGTATAEATTGRDRVQAGFAAYFTFVTENEAAFRVLFGAAARNDRMLRVARQRPIVLSTGDHSEPVLDVGQHGHCFGSRRPDHGIR